MPRALLLTVRFHDGRYHGTGPWPPSPARLYQALVAGAAEGSTIPPEEHKAFAWFERLPPPDIAAPPARAGQDYKNYVPNNDLDAKGGDPDRVAEIRAPKQIRPRLFDPQASLLYLWRFEGGEAEARMLVSIAERLYQLGRGVDMAWASAELLGAEKAEARLAAHGGAIHRPANGDGMLLACPVGGSLESLTNRHKAVGERLQCRKAGRRTQQTFSQPPKPRFAQVAYNSPPERRLFDLRDLSVKAGFHAWPLREAARLVETVRNKAAARLRKAYEEAGWQDRIACVERVFIGRDATEADKPARIRITPLPSIGFHHADPSIRRILLEIQPDCPLPRADVAWAFAGLGLVERIDSETGEISQDVRLVEAENRRMLDHYGIAGDRRDVFRIWRTVTPAVLPERAARRRIDPKRMQAEAKAAAERAGEEARATSAVLHALRHARIAAKVEAIRVQREPFAAKGARAEAFAPGTRFAKERLWHIEIVFATPMSGPLIIGDGRYLGLGLMAPVKEPVSLHAFTIDALVAEDDATMLVRALRRAIMARVRDVLGMRADEGLPTYFCGHEADGTPARATQHEHLFFAVLPGPTTQLLVIAPHRLARRVASRREHEYLHTLDAALAGFTHIKAGSAGVHDLSQLPALALAIPLMGPAHIWESRTPYRPTRHASRGKDVAVVVVQDALIECERRGLPRPEVTLLAQDGGPNGGNLSAHLRLRFAVAVEGPIMLGRDSHMGGGLFVAADEDGHAGR